jgi:hypothetical protein
MRVTFLINYNASTLLSSRLMTKTAHFLSFSKSRRANGLEWGKSSRRRRDAKGEAEARDLKPEILQAKGEEYKNSFLLGFYAGTWAALPLIWVVSAKRPYPWVFDGHCRAFGFPFVPPG